MTGWWWDRPEFVEAQQDESFQAWVQGVELRWDLEGVGNIIPDIPANMFSDEALPIAEQALLDTFPDRASWMTDETVRTSFEFIGYFGQYFVHNLECRWVNQPKVEKYAWYEGGPAIEEPWDPTYLLPMVANVRVAVIRRTGTEFSRLYSNNRRDYTAWVAVGRPPVAD